MKVALIPTDILKNRKFTVMESLVKFLKEDKELSYSQIAELINRDPRNVWTIYSRVKSKNE